MSVKQDTVSRKAGVAVRHSRYESHKDDFPTPPWAVRSFIKYVAPEILKLPRAVVLEPACGRGHVTRTLQEYNLNVVSSDRVKYSGINYGVKDFLTDSFEPYDLLITNPPYWLAQEFAEKALLEAKLGVGLLVRTLWLEGKGRYERLFSPFPPTRIAIFSKRMPAFQGKIGREGSAMMSHAWFWWNKKSKTTMTELTWLPPNAQQQTERDEDYR